MVEEWEEFVTGIIIRRFLQYLWIFGQVKQENPWFLCSISNSGLEFWVVVTSHRTCSGNKVKYSSQGAGIPCSPGNGSHRHGKKPGKEEHRSLAEVEQCSCSSTSLLQDQLLAAGLNPSRNLQRKWECSFQAFPAILRANLSSPRNV